MQSIVSSLLLQFGVDNAALRRDLSTTQKTFGNWKTGILRDIVAPLAAALSVKSLFSDFYRDSVEFGEFSKRFKVGVEDIQAYGMALHDTQGDVKDLTDSLEAVYQTQQKLRTNPSGGNIGWLNAMGIDWVKMAQQNVNALDAIKMYADAYKKNVVGLNDNAWREGLETLGLKESLIKQIMKGEGAAGLELDADEYRKYAEVSEQNTKDVLAFSAALKDLKSSIKAMAPTLFGGLIKPLTSLAKGLQKGIDLLLDYPQVLQALGVAIAALSVGSFVKLATSISSVLTLLSGGLIPGLTGVTAAAGGAAGKVALAGGALGKLAAASAPIGLVAAGVAGVTLAVKDLANYADGKKSILSGLWKHFGEPDEVKANLDKAKAYIGSFWANTKQAWSDGCSILAQNFSAAVNDGKGILEGTLDVLAGVVTLNGEKIGKGIYSVFVNLNNLLFNFTKGMVETVKGLYTGLEQWATETYAPKMMEKLHAGEITDPEDSLYVAEEPQPVYSADGEVMETIEPEYAEPEIDASAMLKEAVNDGVSSVKSSIKNGWNDLWGIKENPAETQSEPPAPTHVEAQPIEIKAAPPAMAEPPATEDIEPTAEVSPAPQPIETIAPPEVNIEAPEAAAQPVIPQEEASPKATAQPVVSYEEASPEEKTWSFVDSVKNTLSSVGEAVTDGVNGMIDGAKNTWHEIKSDLFGSDEEESTAIPQTGGMSESYIADALDGFRSMLQANSEAWQPQFATNTGAAFPMYQIASSGNRSVTIEKIDVVTQATDADGIAKGIDEGLKRELGMGYRGLEYDPLRAIADNAETSVTW